jgi:hypothetical protein
MNSAKARRIVNEYYEAALGSCAPREVVDRSDDDETLTGTVADAVDEAIRQGLDLGDYTRDDVVDALAERLMLARDLKRIEARITDLGMDLAAAGPVSCLCVQEAGRDVRIYDDAEEVTLPAASALEALSHVDAACGDVWETVWRLLCDAAR